MGLVTHLLAWRKSRQRLNAAAPVRGEFATAGAARGPEPGSTRANPRADCRSAIAVRSPLGTRPAIERAGRVSIVESLLPIVGVALAVVAGAGVLASARLRWRGEVCQRALDLRSPGVSRPASRFRAPSQVDYF
jgi:hypothetical protein